jgi:hypothetical protein
LIRDGSVAPVQLHLQVYDKLPSDAQQQPDHLHH